MLKVIQEQKCRRCGKRLSISVIEEEYDYEVSCFLCGELWWVEKGTPIRFKGDSLKYKSSSKTKASSGEKKKRKKIVDKKIKENLPV